MHDYNQIICCSYSRFDVGRTSRMALSMLVVTPSPSFLTRQLLIG